VTLETLVLHGSDWIEWLDASGPQGGRLRTVPAHRLDVQIDTAPADLRCRHQSFGTVLLRRQPEQMQQTLAGAVDATTLTPPPQTPYPVSGTVQDHAGEFLPRHFSVEAGSGAGHRIRLYRSALGTRFGRGGGLRGRLLHRDGTPAPWAQVEVVVTLPMLDPITFTAQADAHAEFSLALDRLPALTRDAPEPTYSASVTVRKAPAAPAPSPADPDALTPARLRVADGPDAAAVFDDHLTIEITPGRVAPLTSPGQPTLVLDLP
jgi:hypothetical protein